MRRATTVMLAALFLATLCAARLKAAEPSVGGPVLVELNGPLLNQPLVGSAEDEAAAPSDEKPPEVSSETPLPAMEGPSLAEPDTDETKTAEPAKTTEAAAEPTVVEEKVEEKKGAPAADSQPAKTEPSTAVPGAGQSAAAPPEEPKPKPALTEEMKSLRAAVRRTLATYYAQPLNTRDNTPSNILEACMAFGCAAQVLRDSPGGQKINAFTCLCSNYPCAGRGLLRIADGRIMAEVGYGLQEYPAEFLAVLAVARVPVDYSLYVGDQVRKVSDLVASEQRACRSGEETSFRLIGLTRYVPADATWQNDLGEEWSITRLLREELDRPAEAAPAGGTFRLFALAYVVDRRVKRGEPIDGQFARARDYLAKVTDYAMELQNPDGSWHPAFFAYRGQAGNLVDQLRSTGHILRWLALTLPDEKLRDPRIVRSVTFLNSALDMRRSRTYVYAGSTREIAARLAAVQALDIYDERLFVPYDEREKVKQPKQDEAKQDSVAGRPAKRS